MLNLLKARRCALPRRQKDGARKPPTTKRGPGEHKRIAVKVIDFRGNEVVMVAQLANKKEIHHYEQEIR